MIDDVKRFPEDFDEIGRELEDGDVLLGADGRTGKGVTINASRVVGGGGSSSGHSTISATPPKNPSNGDHWTSTITYIDYTYVSGAWIEL